MDSALSRFVTYFFTRLPWQRHLCPLNWEMERLTYVGIPDIQS